MNKELIEPRFRVARIEETQHYTDPKLTNAAGKIYAIFLYDQSRQTFCCELTPSYELHYIDTVTEERVEDEIYDQIQEANYHRELVEYQHTAKFASMSSDDNKPFSEDWSPNIDDYSTEEAYRELLEEIIADERANPTY